VGGDRTAAVPDYLLPCIPSVAPTHHPPPRSIETGGRDRPNGDFRKMTGGIRKGWGPSGGREGLAFYPLPRSFPGPKPVVRNSFGSQPRRRPEDPRRNRTRQRPRASHANTAMAHNARRITPRATMPSMPTKGGAHTCHRFGIGAGIETYAFVRRFHSWEPSNEGGRDLGGDVAYEDGPQIIPRD